jgi:hypothetical protein
VVLSSDKRYNRQSLLLLPTRDKSDVSLRCSIISNYVQLYLLKPSIGQMLSTVKNESGSLEYIGRCN